MRLVWLTDLHLNFVTAGRIERLKYEIALQRPEALLVGGDKGGFDTALDGGAENLG